MHLQIEASGGKVEQLEQPDMPYPRTSTGSPTWPE